jgi:hypothetical protein
MGGCGAGRGRARAQWLVNTDAAAIQHKPAAAFLLKLGAAVPL